MTTNRTVALTVLTADAPAIVDGQPSAPAYWAKSDSSATLIQGPNHIHAIKDPNPIWNPYTSGWYYPPPPVSGSSAPFSARWSVNDLPDPDPFPGGWYWLGDPTSQDGTATIQTGCRQWYADRSTPDAPHWQSFFPFKPSVRSFDSFLPGGNVVHHPKGVHFNSHFIEHMWADFGRDHRQPFTWVIAGMIASYPSLDYRHFLLDAGSNPDYAGFPRISAEQCNTPRRIADGLNYHSLIAMSPSQGSMAADSSAAAVVRLRVDAGLRPKMFFGIFNAGNSYLGAYDPGAKRIQKGAITDGAVQHHRHYVIGRRRDWMAQIFASHMMIFELRFWDHALTGADLAGQYAQLSSTYQFDRYRAI